ncbi:UNVERIFIED_CONTAM: hypothetical protein RMT77_013515 [Armadillidium vulgare]
MNSLTREEALSEFQNLNSLHLRERINLRLDAENKLEQLKVCLLDDNSIDKFVEIRMIIRLILEKDDLIFNNMKRYESLNYDCLREVFETCIFKKKIVSIIESYSHLLFEENSLSINNESSISNTVLSIHDVVEENLPVNSESPSSNTLLSSHDMIEENLPVNNEPPVSDIVLASQNIVEENLPVNSKSPASDTVLSSQGVHDSSSSITCELPASDTVLSSQGVHDSSSSITCELPTSNTVLSNQNVNMTEKCLNIHVAEVLVSFHASIDPSYDQDIPLKFNGKQKNKFAFKNFLDKFLQYMREKDFNDTFKLIYLRYYLYGDALELIKHLPINKENYTVALNILKEKYLDKPFLIDCILKKIIKAPLTHPPVTQFSSDSEIPNFLLKIYLLTMQEFFLELQELDVDFLQPNSPGLLMASRIVLDKLPPRFKKELIAKTCKNPTLIDIFQYYDSL